MAHKKHKRIVDKQLVLSSIATLLIIHVVYHHLNNITMTIDIHTLIRTARTNLLLVSRSIDGTESSYNTELDVLEMLMITDSIIHSRLIKTGVYYDGDELVAPTHYEERRGDAKDGYKKLYESIKLDVIDCIRGVMKTSQLSCGPIVQRFVTVGLDSIFDVLREVEPHRAAELMNAIRKAAFRDILNLREVDTLDSMVAIGVLSKQIKARVHRNRRPLTKAERLIAIHTAVIKATKPAA